MAVAERVKSIIVSQLNVDEAKVTWEARLKEDLGVEVNSPEMIELCMALEEEFNIEFSDVKDPGFPTVSGLIIYIQVNTN